MRIDGEQRAALKKENRAYHHARKWYNIEHLAKPLLAVRRKLNASSTR
jgi:hypothetical protein